MQLSFAQNNQAISITVANSSYVPLTNTEANQVRVHVKYTVEDKSIENQKINAVMKVYGPNGTLLRTTSFPGGFTAKHDGGVQGLKSTFNDKSLQSLLANITFTDLAKKKSLSNAITVNLNLEEAPAKGNTSSTSIQN